MSTVTSVSFSSPHFLMYVPLNHLSKAGTKWFHCTIRRVFLPAGEVPAPFLHALTAIPPPSAAAPRAPALMTLRREVLLAFSDMAALLFDPVPRAAPG